MMIDGVPPITALPINTTPNIRGNIAKNKTPDSGGVCRRGLKSAWRAFVLRVKKQADCR